MSQEISVLTALTPDHSLFLPETWTSLQAQAIPSGWSIAWYIQEDGPESDARGVVANLNSDVVHYAASGHRGGPGEARNLALARARGDIIMVLDADDSLTDGAITRVIETLDYGHLWCGFGAIDDVRGTRTVRTTGYSKRLGGASANVPPPHQFDPREWIGESPRGSLRSCWNLCGVLPFHPATFATYAQLLWDVGGWPALSRDEDTAVILALSDRHNGFVSDESNIVYRHHGLQTSRRVDPNDERLDFIEKRLRH